MEPSSQVAFSSEGVDEGLPTVVSGSVPAMKGAQSETPVNLGICKTHRLEMKFS